MIIQFHYISRARQRARRSNLVRPTRSRSREGFRFRRRGVAPGTPPPPPPPPPRTTFIVNGETGQSDSVGRRVDRRRRPCLPRPPPAATSPRRGTGPRSASSTRRDYRRTPKAMRREENGHLRRRRMTRRPIASPRGPRHPSMPVPRGLGMARGEGPDGTTGGAPLVVGEGGIGGGGAGAACERPPLALPPPPRR